MSLTQAKERLAGLLTDLGRGNLHSLYPNEFEYYLMTMELINSKGFREDMLVFPVLPEELRYTTNTLSSVKKTSAGVVSLFNPTFVPFSINISGTFGKKLRLLLGDKEILSLAFNIRTKVSKQSGSKPESTWNTRIRTGYGVTKTLEQMIVKSQSLDEDGKPYKLIFFDSCFNTDSVVEVNTYSFSQSARSNNGYWDYSLQMTALAPAVAVKKSATTSLNRLVAVDQVNRFIQGFVDNNRAGFLKRLNRP